VEPPASYEVIGLVTARSNSGFTDQAKTDGAMNELKEQAARLGANGIGLGGTSNPGGGQTSAMFLGGHSGVIVTGTTGAAFSGQAIRALNAEVPSDTAD
jgi:hypothetical protein